jgi:hypothetical protein
MGNRAYVIFIRNSDKPEYLNGIASWSPAVYLHWNGGAESVYAFLAELHRRRIRPDQSYESARFIQIAGDFFDCGSELTTLSLGVENLPDCSSETLLKFNPGDNGIYLVERGTGELGIKRMRRIVGQEEQTPAWVEAERKKALAHCYARKMAEAFTEITQEKLVGQYS